MAKNQAAEALLVALALSLAPTLAFAQPAKGRANATTAKGDDAKGDDDDATPKGDDDDATPKGDDDDDTTVPTGDDDDDEEPVGLEALCKIDPDNCIKVDMDAYARRDINPEMYAVQQIWALRARRVEINPYAALTLNDQFVAHPGPGLALNYYILNWLAAGINGNVYAGMNAESDFNFQTSRAARIGQPITEYQWNANVNVTFVPAYGKFAAFSDWIFHYDFYFLVGGGAISTRPIAVVDPDNRTFEFTVRPTWGAAAGLRIFFTRYLAAMLELRDYMFFDDLENPSIATGFDKKGKPLTQAESTWLARDPSFTNNVQAQLGLSLFLPVSWKYSLPK